MKKQIGLFTALLFAVSTLMVGCKAEVHTHTFAEEWSSDETNHWHAATCGCSDVELQKTEHTFGDWTITKEATEEAEGSQEKSCSVCEYKVTEVIAKLEHKHKFASEWKSDETDHWHAATCEHEVTEGKTAHTFGDWITTKTATEEETGSKERVCDVCKHKDTEVIEKLEHTHKFATEWTSDETNHWHASTCGHEVTEGKTAHTFGDWITTKDASGHWYECECGAKKDFEEHTYGIWKVGQEPTDTQAGRNERTCKDCVYIDSVVLQPAPEGFKFVKGTTITGTESWTPESEVFVSGRKLTIPDLIVSDHEVTRGEYKDVMGSDPSTASAYDKEGNKLTGNAVLNNPVNYVYWYDAILYCNKLSIKEKLNPCYIINGSTNPDDWGEGAYGTWDRAICDFEANGYRLPTEAEWEWLARGGENYTYAGSDNVDEVAWYEENTNDTGTREVKTKAPNGYGLYDMSGNVYEWCWDWWDGDISDSTAAGGAATGSSRVHRGGSWGVSANGASFCLRYGTCPITRRDVFGFRVVRTAN